MRWRYEPSGRRARSATLLCLLVRRKGRQAVEVDWFILTIFSEPTPVKRVHAGTREKAR